ncbi:MAG: phosphatidylinositol mannoside acyltransferase [Frankiaceae bacterium]
MPTHQPARVRMKEHGKDIGYALCWGAVRKMPEPMAERIFARVADQAWRMQGKGVRRLRANLARVAPDADLDALTRQGVRSYARYWLEIFRLPDMSAERIVGNMHVHDEERIFEAHARGKGAVLALPHMGNWDHAGAWLVHRGVPFTTVAERLQPESLFDRFVEFRESLGMEVIALTGTEQSPFDLLADRLASGRMLCLLSERDLTSHGVPVTFFGETATMPAGPAALCLLTGATLLPTTVWFTPNGWEGQIYPPVPHTDIPSMTQTMADNFAESIAAHPADWHMLQRLWRADLGTRSTLPS